MLASELYAGMLGALTATRRAMLSPDWVEAQQQGSPETRLAAARTLVEVQQAIAALSNAVLDRIATAMEAEAGAIQDATAGLQASLVSLSHVQGVLNAVATMIAVVRQLVVLI